MSNDFQDASIPTPPAAGPAAQSPMRLVDTDDLVWALGAAAVEKIGTGKQIANLRAALAETKAALDKATTQLAGADKAATARTAQSDAAVAAAKAQASDMLKRNAELAKKVEWQDQQRLTLEKDARATRDAYAGQIKALQDRLGNITLERDALRAEIARRDARRPKKKQPQE